MSLIWELDGRLRILSFDLILELHEAKFFRSGKYNNIMKWNVTNIIQRFKCFCIRNILFFNPEHFFVQQFNFLVLWKNERTRKRRPRSMRMGREEEKEEEKGKTFYLFQHKYECKIRKMSFFIQDKFIVQKEMFVRFFSFFTFFPFSSFCFSTLFSSPHFSLFIWRASSNYYSVQWGEKKIAEKNRQVQNFVIYLQLC